MSERVRFAPSPTGFLHIGNARTALFNYLFVKRYGGSFVLRIEDTDRERSSEEYEKAIMEDLRWLGIEWDEGPDVGGEFGPYRQSERLSLYREHVQKLLKEGKAFYCFCGKRDLQDKKDKGKDKRDHACREIPLEEALKRIENGEKPVVRFKVEPGKTKINDLLLKPTSFDNRELGDFPIARSDLTPLYNLSVVVDDHLMGITTVIRGADHYPNTAKQLLLYKSFGYEPPKFLHLPLIMGPDGSPLSKRHGHTSLREYRREGFLPEAIVNYLAMLGWSPGDDREFFRMEDLIREFSLEGLSKANARFNVKKLLWYNGKYIRELPLDELCERALPFVEELVGERKETFKKVMRLYQPRVRKFAELPSQIDYFFREVEVSYEGELPWLAEVYRRLEGLSNFSATDLERLFEKYMAETGKEPKEVLAPLRVLLTGKPGTPNLYEVMEILGKELVLKRLKKALK